MESLVRKGSWPHTLPIAAGGADMRDSGLAMLARKWHEEHVPLPVRRREREGDQMTEVCC